MRQSPDTGSFHAADFASQIRRMRGKTGLRATASEIGGITASTLSRIENGGIPDLDSFIRICHWLNASPNDFIVGFTESGKEFDTPAIVAAHFRADKVLSRDTAEALSAAVKALYSAAKRGEL